MPLEFITFCFFHFSHWWFTSIFFFLFLISLLRYISILWILSNHAGIVQSREHICILIVFLFSISFISVLIFIISFFNFYFNLLFFEFFKVKIKVIDLRPFFYCNLVYSVLLNKCYYCHLSTTLLPSNFDMLCIWISFKILYNFTSLF